MKRFNTSLILLLVTLFLTSCAGYVARVHREIDRDIAEQQGLAGPDQFQQYRRPEKLIPPAQRMQNLRQDASPQSYAPRIKRQYRSTDSQDHRSPKRVTASDLVDNNPSQSLWVSQDENRDLFTNNKSLRQGDIVLVNVYKKLKNEITLELKRAFPAPPSAKKEDNQDGENNSEAERDPAEEELANNETKVYDRVSTVIVEEVNNDHVLLRGRKNLLYQNRKRLVEIQALVARRDLSQTDTVDSNDIIESSITVLR